LTNRRVLTLREMEEIDCVASELVEEEDEEEEATTVMYLAKRKSPSPR